MRPLILRDVAEDIGMHESTVSRVTSNKYVHCPQGIFELKYFFSTAVATVDGDTVAAEAIKNRIRQMVGAENPAKPLGGNTISEMLARENIMVARRTVGKYEQVEDPAGQARRRPAPPESPCSRSTAMPSSWN